MKCIDIMIELVDSSGQEWKSWTFLKTVLTHLQKDGMSSEEEGVVDAGTTFVTVYYVKLCAWRAKKVTEYMDIIDASVAAVKVTKGSDGASRVRTDGIGSGDATPGMPEKMYDEEWLAEKKVRRPLYVVEELCVSKEAFELMVVVLNKGKGRAPAPGDRNA